MFIAYKLVQIGIRPEVWILALLVGALVLLRRPERARLGWRLLAGATLLYYALATRPMAQLLTRPLEWRHSPFEGTPGAPPFDAIVVLGGGSGKRPVSGRATILGSPSLDRLTCGLELLQEGHASRIVLAGGVADPFGNTPAEADTMKATALALGFPEEAILAESTSRTTAENAARVRKLLPDARRVLLVTSAMHVPRASALFRNQGFDLVAAPCDATSGQSGWTPTDFIPSASNLRGSGAAIHEYVGIAVSRLRGEL